MLACRGSLLGPCLRDASFDSLAQDLSFKLGEDGQHACRKFDFHNSSTENS